MTPEQKTMEQVIASLPISDVDGGLLPDRKRLKISMKQWEQISMKERDAEVKRLKKKVSDLEYQLHSLKYSIKQGHHRR